MYSQDDGGSTERQRLIKRIGKHILDFLRETAIWVSLFFCPLPHFPYSRTTGIVMRGACVTFRAPAAVPFFPRLSEVENNYLFEKSCNGVSGSLLPLLFLTTDADAVGF